jgi:hypothetical protein
MMTGIQTKVLSRNSSSALLVSFIGYIKNIYSDECYVCFEKGLNHLQALRGGLHSKHFTCGLMSFSSVSTELNWNSVSYKILSYVYILKNQYTKFKMCAMIENSNMFSI